MAHEGEGQPGAFRQGAAVQASGMANETVQRPVAAAPMRSGHTGAVTGFASGAGVAAVLVAVAVGYWAFTAHRAQQAATAVATAQDTSAQPGAKATAASVQPAPAQTDVVRFDLLRATPEGSVTLAGQAEAGAIIEVLVDGTVADKVAAGSDGSFVSLFNQPPSAQMRVLSVRVTGRDGVAHLSQQDLTLAASPAEIVRAATAAGQTPAAVADQVAAAEALAQTPIVAGPDGARLLADASATLVIDTLTLSGQGRIDISGRGAPRGSVLRAYVDNAESGLAAAGADGGWQMALPTPARGPGTGSHMLRVDALDAAGKVVARAEQAFAAPTTEAASGPASASGAGIKAASMQPHSVTIREGETLWAVARETYGDPLLYIRVFQANREQIRNPDLIYPGQVFTLP